MLNIRKLALLLVLFLCLPACLSSQALNGHEITNFNFFINPSNPIVGKTVDRFRINFDLKSPTGIDIKRIKILVNNIELKTDPSDFTIVSSDSKHAEVTYLADGVLSFSAATNVVKVQYWLTSLNGVPPQAEESFTVKTIVQTGSSGTGTGSTTINGTTSNGGASITRIPKVFSMTVDEVAGSDKGRVSTVEKQFRISLEHNGAILDLVTEENFDPTLYPFLKNLKIKSKRLKTNIAEDFTFELEKASEAVNGRPSFFKTLFISNGVVFTQGDTLTFSADLDSFVTKSGITLADEVITSDEEKIKIDPLVASFTNIELSKTSVDFSITDSSSKKIGLESTPFNIVASTEGNGDILPSSFNSIEFSRTKGAFKKPVIKLKSGSTLSISPELNGSALVNGGVFTIPTIISLKTSKANLNPKKKFTDSSVSKSLIIPFTLSAFNDEGLEILLKGTFNEKTTLNFDLGDLFTTTNGSSL